MIKRILIPFLGLFVFYSCANDVIPDLFDFGKETQFRINEIYSNNTDSLVFKISGISDSRCPIGVTCIWEGEARIELAITSPGKDTLELSTHNQLVASSGKYTFELIEVFPYPDIEKEIEPGDYKVTMVVTKESE